MHDLFLGSMGSINTLLAQRNTGEGGRRSYIVSERCMTLVDIVIYNEISLFMLTNDYELDSSELQAMPQLLHWYQTLMPQAVESLE